MVLLKTRKSVLALAEVLKAQDLTNMHALDVEKFLGRDYNNPFLKECPDDLPPVVFPGDYTLIACSIGIYGINSLLIQNVMGGFGIIRKRNSLLSLLL